MTVTVKHGDKYPTTWTANMDLTGAAVRLIARKNGGDPIVLPVTVSDPTDGIVTHTLTGTLDVGSYHVELEVTLGEEVITFPNDTYERLIVVRDLD